MMQPNKPIREQLLGYLLEALEPDERHRLEADLLQDPALQRDLEELNDSLEPLRLTEGPPEPPAGLAERTCQMIAAFQARSTLPQVNRHPLAPVGFSQHASAVRAAAEGLPRPCSIASTDVRPTRYAVSRQLLTGPTPAIGTRFAH